MKRNFFDLNLDLNASSENPASGNSVTGGVQYWQYQKEVPSLQVQEDMRRRSVVHDVLPSSTVFPLSSAISSDSTSKYPSSLSKNMPNVMWNIRSPTATRNTVSHDHDACIATTRTRITSDSTTVYPMSPQGISSIMEKPAFFSSASLNDICLFNKKPADHFRENTRPSRRLIILYGNDVHVYDEISPQKAESIMSMAKNAASGTSNADINLATDKPPVSDAIRDKQLAITGSKGVCLITASQARKASLDRFLENRNKGRTHG